MMNFCNSYHTNGKITRVITIITAMAAYSNKRVAAIVLSVLYRMLTTFVRYYDELSVLKRRFPPRKTMSYTS